MMREKDTIACCFRSLPTKRKANLILLKRSSFRYSFFHHFDVLIFFFGIILWNNDVEDEGNEKGKDDRRSPQNVLDIL